MNTRTWYSHTCIPKALYPVLVHMVLRHAHAYLYMQALMHIPIYTYIHVTNHECMRHTRDSHVCMFSLGYTLEAACKNIDCTAVYN